MTDYKNDDFYTEDDGIEFIDDDNDDVYEEYDDYDDDAYYKSADNSQFNLVAEIFSFIKIIAIAVLIAFIFTQFVIVNAQVPTGSMKNTIMEGDRLIGYRLSYLFSEPKRGDIVIFKFPDDETENYVKRIIGIPGDVIQIKDGQVYINGELSVEDYLREPMTPTGSEQTYIVPEDSYFMMGDNRNSSADSRFWTNTYVKRDKILAKVGFRYFNGETRRIDFSFIK